MEFKNTIVTACDSNYVWGAYILVASLCYFNVKSYKHVLGIKLSEKECKLLEQFENTKVFNQQERNGESVCLMKPHAIYSADTELITWMDSDCMATGDVTDLIRVEPDTIQIRFRSMEENAMVYRNYYGKKDSIGTIPKKVLNIWQKDVNDLNKSQISTVCETNCFVMRKSNLDFIKMWQEQMEKVIVDNKLNVYNKDSIGYFMTDESVFNSLFAFSSKAPKIDKYLFDVQKDKMIAHFGLNPKPWIHWTKRSFEYYNLLQNILTWCKDHGYETPPIPNSLKAKYKSYECLRANISHSYRSFKYNISTSLHSLHTKVRD